MRRTGIVLAVLALVVGAAATALGATRGVSIHDSSFSPRSVSIRKGSTVHWTWRSSLPHNVTVVRGPQHFHSRTGVGLSYSHRFTRKGTYTLECTVHDFRMTVKVH